MSLHLRQAADRPADVAGELPVVELLRADVEPGQLVVALEVWLHVADSAEPLVGHAESPRAHEREREVAHRLVDMCELPVEHPDETFLRADDDVADAVV